MYNYSGSIHLKKKKNDYDEFGGARAPPIFKLAHPNYLTGYP